MSQLFAVHVIRMGKFYWNGHMHEMISEQYNLPRSVGLQGGSRPTETRFAAFVPFFAFCSKEHLTHTTA